MKKSIKILNKKSNNKTTMSKLKYSKFYLENYLLKKELKILQIGFFNVEPTFWFLNNLINNSNSLTIIINKLSKYNDEIDFKNIEKSLNENIEKTNNKKNVSIIKMLPSCALIHLHNNKKNVNNFDIISINYSVIDDDGLTNAILSWGLLKEGGIIIFTKTIKNNSNDNDKDNDNDNDYSHPFINNFLDMFKPQLKVLYIGKKIFLQKIKLPEFKKSLVSITLLENRFKKTVNEYFSIEYTSLNELKENKENIFIKPFNKLNYRDGNNYELNLYYYFKYFILDYKNIDPYKIKFTETISSYYQHYSSISIKKKYISILDTSYAIKNQNVLDSIYTLYSLKKFNNKIINKYVDIKSKGIGGPNKINQGLETIINDQVSSIESYLYNTIYIRELQSKINYKFDIIRLLCFHKMSFMNKDLIKNCFKLIYGNFIFGLNFQEINGTLIFPNIYMGPHFDYNFIYFLSWTLNYYSNIKIKYYKKTTITIIFENFKGISTTKMNSLNKILDELEIVDFYTTEIDIEKLKEFSAYKEYLFPVYKIDTRVISLLNNVIDYFNTKIDDLINLINYYNDLYIEFNKEENKHNVETLKTLILNYQIKLFTMFINKYFILSKISIKI